MSTNTSRVTHAKNQNQHPGQVLLDTKRKRRTAQQKQVDDAWMEEVRLEAAATRKCGIKRLDDIISHRKQEEIKLLTNRPKPRSTIHTSGSTTVEWESPDSAVEGLETSETSADDPDDSMITQRSTSGRQRPHNTSTPNIQGDQRDAGAHQGIVGAEVKQVHIAADKPEKGKIIAKSHIVGLGVDDWMDKLAPEKFPSTLLSQRQPAIGSHRIKSISTVSSRRGITAPCPTPASSSTSRPLDPAGDGTGIATESRDDPYIQGSDEVEHRSIISNSKLKAPTYTKPTMDIMEVIEASEPDEPLMPPPPMQVCERLTNTKDKKKRSRPNQPDIIKDSQPEPALPPPKRFKTESLDKESVSSRCSGSDAYKKYVKDNLPAGCTADNKWRRLFISALAHFASGYGNPWAIPSDTLKSMLQDIWDKVYGGQINHTVTTTDMVFHIAKQSLNIWCSGFAATAVAVLTTFFANDPDFGESAQRVEFAKALLANNRFLFQNNKGEDLTAWTGLWRALFVLQTFAHHLNYIHGRAEVPVLDSEQTGPRAALALACTAVCCVLTLTTEDHISFNPSENGDHWTAVIPKGNQFEFNDAVWGTMSRCYLEPISELSDENLEVIVDETQKYLKKTTLSSAVTSTETKSARREEVENLFKFR